MIASFRGSLRCWIESSVSARRQTGGLAAESAATRECQLALELTPHRAPSEKAQPLASNSTSTSTWFLAQMDLVFGSKHKSSSLMPWFMTSNPKLAFT